MAKITKIMMEISDKDLPLVQKMIDLLEEHWHVLPGELATALEELVHEKIWNCENTPLGCTVTVNGVIRDDISQINAGTKTITYYGNAFKLIDEKVDSLQLVTSSGEVLCEW